MTVAHQIVGVAALVVTAALFAIAVASWLSARRTAGGVDHRFLVDRVVLATVGAIGAAALLGLVEVVAGRRPSDPLHLLYAVLGVAGAPLGWAFGGRPDASGRSSRRRRDAWISVSAAILLAIEARLILTG